MREHDEVCAAQCYRIGPLFVPLTVRQLAFYFLSAAAILIFFLWDYKVCYTVLTFVLCAFYGLIIVFRLLSVKLALFKGWIGFPDEHRIRPDDIAALKNDELPVYTILVPMYKEPEVAQKIARTVTTLDYPIEKLDVKLLLEEDDPETRKKVEEVLGELPPCVEVIVCPKVPKGQPRTKPRACNWGLDRAKGEYLVIFDAEDRPEGDQLKKSIAAFNKLKAQGKAQVVCLQAKLNYFNARQNMLTRFFTLEYTTWFDLFLPGLHAFRIPIPLGGTSNHFHTETLKKLGGWDPFNVTEDCDLGIRMARQGYRTEVLDSTTWEEANSHVGNWVRQRSRWIKGYFQTHLVHTRDSLWPFFVLAACFVYLARKIGSGLDPASPYYAKQLEWSTLAQGACGLLAAVAAGLGLWAVLERYAKRKTYREGRLNAYGALTFRLTVGGLSAMLILNVVFWLMSGVYLLRKPIADTLPAFTDAYRFEFLDRKPPREVLSDWRLYFENVTEDRYEGYTIWNTSWQWLVQGKLSTQEATEIFGAIDEWSFWSQILYPVVIGLFLANFAFVLLGLYSCHKRGLWDLAPMALLMPFYWVLISVGAVKGAWQLCWNPWYWEKTIHGLDHSGAAPPRPPGPPPAPPGNTGEGVFFKPSP